MPKKLPIVKDKAYITASFKVHNPSGYKRRRMLENMEMLTEQYATLLDILKGQVKSLRRSAYENLKEPDKERRSPSEQNLSKAIRILSSGTNTITAKGILRESVIQESAQSLMSYFELLKSSAQESAQFPSGRRWQGRKE